MRHTLTASVAALVILVVAGRISDPGSKATFEVEAATVSSNRPSLLPPRFDHPAFRYAASRLDSDFSAVETFRPSYPFWQHIFTIPDGAVAFGSANDGRLLASFPRRGNCTISCPGVIAHPQSTGRTDPDPLRRWSGR